MIIKLKLIFYIFLKKLIVRKKNKFKNNKIIYKKRKKNLEILKKY